MISAKEANLITRMNDKTSDEYNLDILEKSIKEAINNGKYYTYHYSYIGYILHYKLEELGYKIKDLKEINGYSYLISW